MTSLEQELEAEEGELGAEFETELEAEGEGEFEWETELEGGGPVRLPPIRVTVRPFVVLDRFRSNEAALRPFHVPLLRRAALQVVRSWRVAGGRARIRTIRLVGHTDSSGAGPHNLALGRRRALIVRTALIREMERLQPGLWRRIAIIPQSAGESRPAVSNASPPGRGRNRRVQIFLSTVGRGARPRPPSGSGSCAGDCRREFERCQETGTRTECFRRFRRCLRDCRGVPV
jgi:outer membrane protein OmpA-like peptidoglycan-associated protein